MDSDSSNPTPRSPPDTTSENLLQRILYRAPIQYTRPPGFIPFHIPHRKLLEKYEHRKDKLEPIVGFAESQNKRRRTGLLPPIQPMEEIKYDYVKEEFERSAVRIMVPESDEEDVEDTGPSMRQSSYVRSRRKSLPEICNQLELIERMRNAVGFLYMIYSVPRSSEFYTPYALRVVPYEKIDKTNFLTISAHGVTQYYPGDMVFTPLPTWKMEYEMYSKLIQIKAFSHFRKWKGFYVWKKNVSWKKFSKARKAINEDLFILNAHLRKALLDIQAMCWKLVDVTFTDMSMIENFPLFEFIEIQMGKLENVVDRLIEFRDLVKEIVNNACHGALLLIGYTTDDSNFLPPELCVPGAPKHPKDTRVKMSYTDQANKRRYCGRLTSFIHLVDFMQVHILHVLSHNSLVEMESVLQKHCEFLPSEELLQDTKTDEILEPPRPAGSPQMMKTKGLIVLQRIS